MAQIDWSKQNESYRKIVREALEVASARGNPLLTPQAEGKTHIAFRSIPLRISDSQTDYVECAARPGRQESRYGIQIVEAASEMLKQSNSVVELPEETAKVHSALRAIDRVRDRRSDPLSIPIPLL